MKKIAVTYENGQVFQHFGHTEKFKVYTVEDGAVKSAAILSANGSGHGALAGLLSSSGVDTLICGGIGGGARAALDQAGIQLYGGVSGDADPAYRGRRTRRWPTCSPASWPLTRRRSATTTTSTTATTAAVTTTTTAAATATPVGSTKTEPNPRPHGRGFFMFRMSSKTFPPVGLRFYRVYP